MAGAAATSCAAGRRRHLHLHQSLHAGNIDQLPDFQVGIDKIGLDDNEFSGLATGFLAPGAFRTGTSALDADDRILYDPVSGALLFDPDGSGAAAAVQFAVLPSGLAAARPATSSCS